MSQSDESINFDILDYLGKHEGGVLVLLSLSYKGNFYDSTFFYTEDMFAITPDEKLEEDLGCQIEDWQGYSDLSLRILKSVLPYSEIINLTTDFNPSDWGLFKN
jgi:hypothetical protein